MKSVVDCDIGKEIEQLLQDVRQFEESGKSRDKTWANTKSQKEVRQMKNTPSNLNHSHGTTSLT